ncbi:unnamed protein product [Pocillopora meandrina]|uniref:Uncharacterized protein n=1 Tax=Pocillopora meandrina TaxID=46732 RepID=A0AAU9XI49_9CNID|nr:unnamed protein product [Pocillopora meandrina]
MQEALEKSLQMFQNPNSGARAESFRCVLVVTGGQSNVKRNKTLLNTMDLKLDAFFFYRLFFLFVQYKVFRVLESSKPQQNDKSNTPAVLLNILTPASEIHSYNTSLCNHSHYFQRKGPYKRICDFKAD